MRRIEVDRDRRRSGLLLVLLLAIALGGGWFLLGSGRGGSVSDLEGERAAAEHDRSGSELSTVISSERARIASDEAVTLTVRDAHTGLPITGAEILADVPSPSGDEADTPVGTTGQDGQWSVLDPSAHATPWAVRAAGYLPGRVDEVPPGATELECRLHRSGSLIVQCRGTSGAKLTGCEVKLNGAFGGPLRRSGTTDASGSLRIDGLPCDTPLRVTCLRRGQLKVATASIEPSVGTSTLRFTLTEADATVTGLLMWADGGPVESSRKLVKLSHRGVRRASRLDADGRFTLVGVPVGQCYLRVDLPSHPSRSLNLVEGINDVGVIEIERLGLVRGLVKGVEDPSSLVVDVLTEGRVIETVDVGQDSTFEVHAPRGPIELELRHRNSPFRTWLTGEKVLCPALGVELDASGTMAALRWSDSSGGTPQRITAICTEMNVLGIPAGVMSRWSLQPPVRSMGGGAWTAGPLPFGTYDVYLDYGPSAGSWHRGIEIGSPDGVDLGSVMPGLGTFTFLLDPLPEEDASPESVKLTSGLHETVTVRVGVPEELLPGPWQVRLPSPGAGLTTRPYVDVWEGRRQTFEWVRENEGRIAGTLTGTLPTERVAQLTLKPLLAYERSSEQDRATADAQGRFVFERVLPGDYELVCEVDDQRTALSVEVTSGETTDVELSCPVVRDDSCEILTPDGRVWTNGRRVVALSASGTLHESPISASGEFTPPLDAARTVVLLISREQPTREMGAALTEVFSIADYARSGTGALEARIREGKFAIRGPDSSAMICHLTSYDGIRVQPSGAFRFQLASDRDEPGSLTVGVPPDRLTVFVREVTRTGGIRIHGEFPAGNRDL